ncbi:PAN2-PAN3 deadenylation complex catalytic subunit PAN2-like [Topomyia yanbarensis]|uniref:PAN2-PAN3 deadenylation complex catalytic subunit PAN2-like n=1 Tax=Topomyia yanbarensis TaxID=2498891 RepID=UPI00273BB68E|nr:PAN2-PAN3 deadenylation complex catalytic subunit PAN2-like [Topomyia yanbarensis]XP_058814048.1 PAN2-PAN3 deadenylation complex catalytic subunit PAN2-like [Topomyia yanbarensis]XP_058814049.1 PAN2-PAN3 deadenylation complex catalytic subunit PAN2-like [Topomyia yanbarensis]XP_058814050.1 PAN2-PAN3 deadenylation complex catalytic subunit PAN2-like [Topomyia yanbarensis]
MAKDAQPTRSNKDETEISRLLGTQQKTTQRCLEFNTESVTNNILLVCNLLYPTNTNNRHVDGTFASCLKKYMSVEKTTPAWCEKCNKFTLTNQKSRVADLPEILSVNCSLEINKELEYLKKQMLRPSAQVSMWAREMVQTKPPPSFNSNASNQGQQKSWFPLGFRMTLDEKENLEIGSLKTDEGSDAHESCKLNMPFRKSKSIACRRPFATSMTELSVIW